MLTVNRKAQRMENFLILTKQFNQFTNLQMLYFIYFFCLSCLTRRLNIKIIQFAYKKFYYLINKIFNFHLLTFLISWSACLFDFCLFLVKWRIFKSECGSERISGAIQIFGSAKYSIFRLPPPFRRNLYGFSSTV